MNRLIFAVIIVFWLTMTTLLVRMQIQPEASVLREVPPARVLALLFEHGQSSTLSIKHNRLTYGTVSINPVIEANGERILRYGGHALLRASYLPHDRLSLEGEMNFDPALEVTEARGSLGLRDQRTRFIYRLNSAAHSLKYSLEMEGEIYRDGTISLRRNDLERLAADLGVDPAILETASASGGSVKLSAHYSTFGYRDEKVQAYSLIIQRENTTLAEIFVSQLGQVLMVKTPFGLELSPSDLMP